MRYAIEDSTLTNIANAVRNMRQEDGILTPEQMAQKINSTRVGIPIEVTSHLDDTGKWVRPNEYPDLDELYENDFYNINPTPQMSVVYLTYDLRKTAGYSWLGIYASGSVHLIERGHVENGSFVADETIGSFTSAEYYRYTLIPENGDIQIFRFVGANVTRFGFVPNTRTNAMNYTNALQPCVERVGRLPHITNFSSSLSTTYSTATACTFWLERDAIDVGKLGTVTTLASMYYYAFSLQETTCGDWDTSNWNVTNISNLFNSCTLLRKIDLSKWDTSNWSVTACTYAFYQLYELKELNISTWDTSKWRPTSLVGMFGYAVALEKLDLHNWDVSNWVVTTVNNTWTCCFSLYELNLSGWDTSKWALTNLSSCWNSCFSLQKLDIQNWETGNWRVTTFANMFSNCRSLRKLDLSGWDTSKWAVTTFTSCWSGCYSLQSLNVSTWETDNWAVTSLESVWSNCFSLKSLDLSNWDTSNWAVVSLASLFSSCYSIESIGFEEWDTSNWAVTSMSSSFSYCYSMLEFDLTAWDTSNWALTTMYAAFNTCYNVKKLDISTWDVSNFALTDTRSLISSSKASIVKIPYGLYGTVANSKFQYNSSYLVEYFGPAINVNRNISNAYRLTRACLLDLIAKLPTVTSTTTLTIGQTNKNKLTSEEIAVATQKGWTVA